MAVNNDKLTTQKFKYKVEMTYLNIAKGINTEIKTECIKFLVIDHDYERNCMPTMYVVIKLDKALVDDMIRNCNVNLFTVALFKYDDNAKPKLDIECFRKKFTYFLPDDVNTNDPIDYNEATNEEHKENTYIKITLGLMCIDHINANKTAVEFVAKNATIYDCVKYCTSHMKNLIIEPFPYNNVYKQIVIPAKDSVNKALEYLNNFRVFYPTPYRFYQDFDFVYIISSSGKITKKSTERYSSVLVSIKEIDDREANYEGICINKDTGTYELIVNYLDTDVYDNTIINKSKNKIKGISSTGSTKKKLKNNAEYSSDKVANVRLNNDNTNMLSNIEAKNNSNNALINVTKSNIDIEVFTINKRYSIRNIERYHDLDGNYLLYRSRNVFVREDTIFTLISTMNFRRIDQ